MAFKISQIRKDAQVRFGDFVIDDIEVDGEPVTLVHTFRLSDEAREELKNAKGLDDIETQEELVETYQHWARTVAKTPEQGQALVDIVGKELDTWVELQVQWTARTQPGEASTSES